MFLFRGISLYRAYIGKKSNFLRQDCLIYYVYGNYGLADYFGIMWDFTSTVHGLSCFKSPYDKRPYGYVFLTSLVPLIISVSYFIRGLQDDERINSDYSWLVGFGGVLITALTIWYVHTFAKGI